MNVIIWGRIIAGTVVILFIAGSRLWGNKNKTVSLIGKAMAFLGILGIVLPILAGISINLH